MNMIYPFIPLTDVITFGYLIPTVNPPLKVKLALRSVVPTDIDTSRIKVFTHLNGEWTELGEQVSLDSAFAIFNKTNAYPSVVGIENDLVRVGDLTNKVRNNIGDEETTSDFLRDRDIAEMCNEGISDFARRTKAFTDSKTISFVAGEYTFDLPPYFRGFEEVRVDGRVMKREISSNRFEPLLNANSFFYSILDGKFIFSFSPTVAGTMTWKYYYLPLVDNSLYKTQTAIPLEYMAPIVNYASAQAAMMLPQPDPSIAAMFSSRYELAVKNVIGEREDMKESSNVEIRNVFNPRTGVFDSDTLLVDPRWNVNAITGWY